MELVLADQDSKVFEDLGILSLRCCVVRLHNQMLWHPLPFCSANAPNSCQCAGQDFTKEGGPMKEVLIIRQIKITTVAMSHCQVNSEFWPVELLKNLRGLEAVLRPNPFTLVHPIDDHGQNSGLWAPTLPP